MVAVAVTTTSEAGGRGIQVAAHAPFFREVSRSGGSALEKVVVTPPVVIGLPQSSTTRTPTWPGYPAGMTEPSDRSVKIGARVFGVQPAVASRGENLALRV